MIKFYVILDQLKAKLIDDERGVSSIEYAIIGALVLGALATAMTTGGVKTNLSAIFGGMTSAINAATPAS